MHIFRDLLGVTLPLHVEAVESAFLLGGNYFVVIRAWVILFDNGMLCSSGQSTCIVRTAIRVPGLPPLLILPSRARSAGSHLLADP